MNDSVIKMYKREIIQTAVGIALLIAAMSVEHVAGGGFVMLLLCVAAYLTLGIGVLKVSLKNILSGQVFDEHFLITIASLAAFAIGDYEEAVAVMMFYSIGELFEEISVERSQRRMTSVMDAEPEEGQPDERPDSEKFITRFAKIYTPIVVGLALFVAIIIPLISMASGGAIFAGSKDALAAGQGGLWHYWIVTAITLLVISCPCAMVISVPMAYSLGVGMAARKGIYVKNSQVLDRIRTAGRIPEEIMDREVAFSEDNAKAPETILTLAKKTGSIAKQNIAGAILIKVIVIVMGLMGFASIWLAAFADNGVCILCILNALRILRV